VREDTSDQGVTSKKVSRDSENVQPQPQFTHSTTWGRNPLLHMDFLGHRFYRWHTFTDLKFFAVTVRQTIGEPRE
jgi:hypothetical protein